MTDVLERKNLKDIEDAGKILNIFSEISEESKTMVLVYLSALRDKEIVDGSNVI